MREKGRILIVDDQPECAETLRRLLRKEYEVETAASGTMCLIMLPVFKPHLVLLDVMMPMIDGYETCRRIKLGPLGNYVQVVLVSDRDTAADRVRGYDSLADDCIVKPFDHDELLSKVGAFPREKHAGRARRSRQQRNVDPAIHVGRPNEQDAARAARCGRAEDQAAFARSQSCDVRSRSDDGFRGLPSTKGLIAGSARGTSRGEPRRPPFVA